MSDLGCCGSSKYCGQKKHMRKGEVFPVLMCGGSDTRLSPLRRQNHPRQFIPLRGNESLFDLTPKRSLRIPGANHGTCVANKAYRFPVSAALGYARSAHRAVVAGTARVTCDDHVFTLRENQSTSVPHGAVHRLENPGTGPLELIEIHCGTYLGRGDIARLQNKYDRMERAEP